MTTMGVWNGSQEQFGVLYAAVIHYCECWTGEPNSPPMQGRCPAHAMLSDQRVLNHMGALDESWKHVQAPVLPRWSD